MKKKCQIIYFLSITLFLPQIFAVFHPYLPCILQVAIFLAYLEAILRNCYVMNVEEIRAFCLEFQGVEESFPFDNQTLVFKVGGKIFLLLALDANPVQFNVKCEPENTIKLREKYACVLPGYHMNKRHWNTILCENNLSKNLAFEWIKTSYFLVFNSLPKSLKNSIGPSN